MSEKKQQKLIIKKRGEDGYKIFSIRIKEDLFDRIDKLASQSGYSRNELIGVLLDFATENCTIVDK